MVGITNDGKEVLKCMENNTPDILLLDLMMPKMNGIEVLDKLIAEKDRFLSKTKIIIISSYIEKLYSSNKYREFIYGLLPKPYDLDKLMQLIDNVDDNIKENNIRKYINNELKKFNFNNETEGYRYLEETIYEILYNDKIKFELEKDIYIKVAKSNHKNPLQIKWVIDKIINTMYINTKYDIIKEYFDFREYKKITSKVFIKHIVENYKNDGKKHCI